MSNPEDSLHYTIHRWTDSEKRKHHQVVLWKVNGFILLFFVLPVIAWIFGLIRSYQEYPPTLGAGDSQIWIGLIFAVEALGFGKLLHWVWSQIQDPSRYDFWDAKADKKVLGSLWVVHHKVGFSSISVLFVHPTYRRRGVGTDIVRSLLKSTKRPVFVRSLPTLRAFYNRCGFVPVHDQHLPFHLISQSYGYNWVYLPKRSIQKR
jgi:GNAT superfamily N-acetyltransferase